MEFQNGKSCGLLPEIHWWAIGSHYKDTFIIFSHQVNDNYHMCYVIEKSG